MNIPQENRIQMILTRIDNYNNYKDDDQIFAAYQQLQNADTFEKVNDAIEYAVSCILYRGGNNTAAQIKELQKEISSFNSLLNAIKNNDQIAINWWEKEAEAGKTMRII